MQVNTLPLREIHQFSPLFLDYITKQEKLKSFYCQFPDIEGFGEQLKLKTFDPSKREILVQVLEDQYKNITNKPNIQILSDENTFTVTTGHQLNIFTGPLYIIYKLITTINLANSLKKAYPEYNFVPVYWMATEDHDFAEIDHFSLFGKTHQWQTEQKGAVGRMNPNEIKTILEEISEKIPLFEEAYNRHDTLADAVRFYFNELFGAQHLVIIDADNRALKKVFSPIIKEDILSQTTLPIVQETSEKLEQLGYKTQVTPREINFFYLKDGLRERIVKENGQYKVLNSDIHFSEEEILKMIENEPEHFSPNVILRPVYQETILPNLAYIGGPSEVPYWLQFKDAFDHFKLAFPILVPRNFALIINKSLSKRMEKLGLSTSELFLDEITLRKNFVEHNSKNQLSLSAETESFSEIFQEILKKAVRIDKTLEGAVNGEKQKLINGLENLEKRLKKAEERNQETEVTQLVGLKQKLFPNGGLQERSENFLNFYLNNPDFLLQLGAVFDALNFEFYVLTEE